MIVNKIPSVTNPLATSNRKKFLFLVLCTILCVIIFSFYSNTTVSWKLLHNLLSNGIVVITYRLEKSNFTHVNNVTNKSINQINSTLLNRRFAIFACSIHSKIHAYSFYTPITASSWKRIGYETIVFFVGDFTRPNALTARLNLSRTYLKYVGAHIIDLQCNETYAVKLSQIVRIFAGFLPDSIVHDDDDIITTDSDLMPLKASEYQPTKGTDGFIFNAFCCGSFNRRGRNYRMFPKSKQRSELLINTTNQTQYLLSENASISFETISLYAGHEFKHIYHSNMKKGDSAWYMDQVLCSMLLTDYREKYKDFKLSERGRAGRLDRANGIGYWNRHNFDQFGDAHLIHDSILQEYDWKIFNMLLNYLFNSTLVNLFNDYHKQYMIIDKIPLKQKR